MNRSGVRFPVPAQLSWLVQFRGSVDCEAEPRVHSAFIAAVGRRSRIAERPGAARNQTEGAYGCVSCHPRKGVPGMRHIRPSQLSASAASAHHRVNRLLWSRLHPSRRESPLTPCGAGDQEAGASPARSRHCHRGATPTSPPQQMLWEGREKRRSGRQDTDPAPPDTCILVFIHRHPNTPGRRARGHAVRGPARTRLRVLIASRSRISMCPYRAGGRHVVRRQQPSG